MTTLSSYRPRFFRSSTNAPKHPSSRFSRDACARVETRVRVTVDGLAAFARDRRDVHVLGSPQVNTGGPPADTRSSGRWTSPIISQKRKSFTARLVLSGGPDPSRGHDGVDDVVPREPGLVLFVREQRVERIERPERLRILLVRHHAADPD